MAFISQAPLRARPDSVVTMPFETPVWASIALLTFCLLLTLKWTVKDRFTLYDLTASLVGLSLAQSSQLFRNLVSLRSRLLIGPWMLALLILTNLYCSVFYSILTVPRYERPIDTIENIAQIARSDSHFILVRRQSTYSRRFTHASPDAGLFYAIGQHIRRTRRELDASVENVIDIVENDPRNVVIRSRLTLVVQRLFYASKKLHIGSESLDSDLIAFMLPKGSPLRVPFDRI